MKWILFGPVVVLAFVGLFTVFINKDIPSSKPIAQTPMFLALGISSLGVIFGWIGVIIESRSPGSSPMGLAMTWIAASIYGGAIAYGALVHLQQTNTSEHGHDDN